MHTTTIRSSLSLMTIATLLLALTACGNGGTGEGSGAAASDPAGDRAAVTVELQDFEIDAPATVSAGTEVTVENVGESTHNWTAADGAFATSDLGPGDQETVTLENAGTVEYRCTIHPDIMTGSIEITG